MPEKFKIHPSVTTDRVLSAVQEDDNIGICLLCGKDQRGCEPDMRNGRCENCGGDYVSGAEEILISQLL